MSGEKYTRAGVGTRLAVSTAAALMALCMPFSGALGQRPHESRPASPPRNSAPHYSAPRQQSRPEFSKPQTYRPQNQGRPAQQYPQYRAPMGGQYQRPSGEPMRANPGMRPPQMNPQAGARGNYPNSPYPGQGYTRPANP